MHRYDQPHGAAGDAGDRGGGMRGGRNFGGGGYRAAGGRGGGFRNNSYGRRVSCTAKYAYIVHV